MVMLLCLIFAGVISMFSIFAFFGSVAGNDLGIGPNMFDLMFGAGYWKMYPWLTGLFALQVVIMIIDCGLFYVCYRLKREEIERKRVISVAGALVFLSVVATVLSFLTLVLTDSADTGLRLGAGPISYSVMHIVSILLIVVGSLYNGSSSEENDEEVEESSSNEPLPEVRLSVVEPSKPVKKVNETKTQPSIAALSENEKADLILKYKSMLDQGILTQEEFDAKKKQLLQ